MQQIFLHKKNAKLRCGEKIVIYSNVQFFLLKSSFNLMCTGFRTKRNLMTDRLIEISSQEYLQSFLALLHQRLAINKLYHCILSYNINNTYKVYTFHTSTASSSVVVLNVAARLIYCLGYRALITDIHIALHWL